MPQYLNTVCANSSPKKLPKPITKSEDSLYNQSTLLIMAILIILQARIFCPFPLEHKQETVHGLIPPPPLQECSLH